MPLGLNNAPMIRMYSYIAICLKIIFYFSIVSLPNTTYSLQLHGPDEISVGMNLIIQCMIMESGIPVEGNDIQLSLVMPNGEVIIGNKFNTVATLEYSGTYSCIALAANATPMMTSLHLIVYGEVVYTVHHS